MEDRSIWTRSTYCHTRKKATHACTEAVEEVIIDHYQKQTQYLKGKDNNLAKITKKFCKEEKEHLDFASEHDTGSDLFHSTLKKESSYFPKALLKFLKKPNFKY